MSLRETSERKRILETEQSLWNPLYLQMRFAIVAVKNYFQSLSFDNSLMIVDFGCGVKPYQVFLDPEHIYLGIDIDKKNTAADVFADLHCVPFKNDVADIVVSFYVLEHVEDPQKVILEKYRILKKGGKVFMLVPLYWEEHEQPYDFSDLLGLL